MSATPNSGARVRGLEVVRRSESRDTSPWRTVINAILLVVTLGDVGEGRWEVLTVHAGSDALARRRFTKRAQAEQARTRFIEAVEALSDDDYERADWQALLDAA